MNECIIHTNDLNSSLVFYRSLFNRMPDVMDVNEVVFNEPHLRLKIKESNTICEDEIKEAFHLDIKKKSLLKELYKRMNRFIRLNQFIGNYEILGDTIGLIDPDGYKWIIGKYQKSISFEKCYVKL